MSVVLADWLAVTSELSCSGVASNQHWFRKRSWARRHAVWPPVESGHPPAEGLSWRGSVWKHRLRGVPVHCSSSPPTGHSFHSRFGFCCYCNPLRSGARHWEKRAVPSAIRLVGAAASSARGVLCVPAGCVFRRISQVQLPSHNMAISDGCNSRLASVDSSASDCRAVIQRRAAASLADARPATVSALVASQYPILTRRRLA